MTQSRIALSALAGGLALAACQWLVYVYAPEEQVMGLAQKIFYIHLPLAWWGLISFALSFVAVYFFIRQTGARRADNGLYFAVCCVSAGIVI